MSATIDLETRRTPPNIKRLPKPHTLAAFHDRIDLTEFRAQYEGGYVRVNRRFADTVRPLIGEGDLVWIHDYHLIPLGLGAPPTRRFKSDRLLPSHPVAADAHPPLAPHARELVLSMFDYDVVGFHTQDWLDAFLEYVTRNLDAELGEDGEVRMGNRVTRAIVAPDRHRRGRVRGGGGGRARPLRPRPHAHEHDRPPAPDRRRPARLLQGAARPLPRL
jgi:trehalose 6-phosphate synthase